MFDAIAIAAAAAATIMTVMKWRGHDRCSINPEFAFCPFDSHVLLPYTNIFDIFDIFTISLYIIVLFPIVCIDSYDFSTFYHLTNWWKNTYA